MKVGFERRYGKAEVVAEHFGPLFSAVFKEISYNDLI
jgi:hypothetical protein